MFISLSSVGEANNISHGEILRERKWSIRTLKHSKKVGEYVLEIGIGSEVKFENEADYSSIVKLHLSNQCPFNKAQHFSNLNSQHSL